MLQLLMCVCYLKVALDKHDCQIIPQNDYTTTSTGSKYMWTTYSYSFQVLVPNQNIFIYVAFGLHHFSFKGTWLLYFM